MENQEMKDDFRIPPPSELLAEFAGILLGDGGITRYQVTITLNARDEELYIKYVSSLIKKLFNFTPAIYDRPHFSVKNIVISRKGIVTFCETMLNAKCGRKIKQQIDIPTWVRNEKNYGLACVRGLIDTDGSVFNHRYRVGGKLYTYKKLEFCTLSFPLLISVQTILKSQGITSRIARRKSIWIDGQAAMEEYVSQIGFSNLKHLKRYLE